MLHFFDSLRRSLTRDDPSAFAAPAQFGPFRVLHQVGVGALGPVFRTYDPDRDRLVAVKVFRLDIPPEQARSLADELSRVAARGLFHPSIVEPIAAGVEGSLAYNAEEYVAAESLDVAMRHYAPASIETVLPFITQLAGAIDFARAAGVGHGALHPRDMFLTPDEARVTGFGIVEALELVGIRAPVRRPYSPPERIAGESWSSSADVFSLAAVTYEMLTGRRPSGLGAEIGALPPGSVEVLHSVLVCAMDEDPSRRYPTALAFAADLEAAAHGRSLAFAGLSAAPPLDEPPTQSEERPLEEFVATGAVPSILDLHDPFPTRETKDVVAEDAAAVDDDREPEDVAAERDEDVAHHRLPLVERNESLKEDQEQIERVPDVDIDEDSRIEAEADRYAADDFLLDAAGAASNPELSYNDDSRHQEERVAFRASNNFTTAEPAALDFEIEPSAARESTPFRGSPTPAPVAINPPAPTFGAYGADVTPPREASTSRVMLAAMLLLGLAVGFGGGYMLWGGAPPAAIPTRTNNERTDAQKPTPAPPSTRVQAGTPSTAATTGSSEKPDAKPSSSVPPTISESAGAAAGSPAPQATGKPAAPARKPNGTIVVRSTPSGAGVTVNGRWRGRTPITIEDLVYAKYDVRVVQPGYAAGRQSVTLSAGDPDRTVTIRLQPDARGASRAKQNEPGRPTSGAGSTVFTGSVFVDSRPRGAKVFIDGKEVGSTPLSVPDVRVGSHVVRLELPDHRNWTSTATVTAGQQTRVTGSLERIP